MSHAATIKQYVLTEFLPDLTAADLADDHDLLADGVIDSLGLLKLIAWVDDTFQLAVDDTDLDPDNFRSVAAIDAFVSASPQATVAGR